MAVREYYLQMLTVNGKKEDLDNSYLVAALTDGVEVIPFIARTLKSLRSQLYRLLEGTAHHYIIRVSHSSFMQAKAPLNIVFMGGRLKASKSLFVDAVLRDIAADILVAHPPRKQVTTSLSQKQAKPSVSVKNVKQVRMDVYTDASIQAGHQTGVYGWVQKTQDQKDLRFSFAIAGGDSNALEVRAIADAITEHRDVAELVIHTDSQYAIQLFFTFSNKTRGEIQSRLVKMKLSDRVASLTAQALYAQQVKLVWVKSHQDDTWNVCADQMVRYARARVRTEPSTKLVHEEVKTILMNLLRNRRA
jgi:ribonuclease HI